MQGAISRKTLNIITRAIGTFLRIEAYVLRVVEVAKTGIKTLALEPSKLLFQAANTIRRLVKRTLQTIAHFIKILLYKGDGNYKLIYIYLEGPNLLLVIVDFSFYLLKGRDIASKLDRFRNIRTFLLYIVSIFPFAFCNILLLLTIFRPIFTNRDLFGYIQKRLRIQGKRVRYIRATRAV